MAITLIKRMFTMFTYGRMFHTIKTFLIFLISLELQPELYMLRTL